MADTSYIVLLLDDEGGWREVPAGPFVGHNDQAAIRKAADGYDEVLEDEPTFVAVPLRSWTPRKLTVTTKRVVTLAPAAAPAAPTLAPAGEES